MSSFTRRDLLKTSMAVSTGLGIVEAHVPCPRGQRRDPHRHHRRRCAGQLPYRRFSKIPGVRYVAVCDPDQFHVNARVKFFADKGLKVDGYTDLRKLLDRKDIDAVIVGHPEPLARPGHGLGLPGGQGRLRREAGLATTISEGRKMVEAARKYDRIVQVGTQSRSSEAHKAAFEWIRAGNIGKIKWSAGSATKCAAPSQWGAATAEL